MTKKRKIGIMFPKTLIIIGAAWMMGFSIVIAIRTESKVGTLFGLPTTWPLLLLVGIMYLLVPFSVRTGHWATIWGCFIVAVSIFCLIGTFLYAADKGIWTYVGAVSYVFLIAGSALWAMMSFRVH